VALFETDRLLIYHFGSSEIGQNQLEMLVQKQVCRFEVSMNDVFVAQVGENADQLSHIEFSHLEVVQA